MKTMKRTKTRGKRKRRGTGWKLRYKARAMT
jgi:hypothetical protein